MSAVIRQLVARKRQIDIDAETFATRQAQIIAAAKGEQGEKGDKGDPGPAPEHEWQGTKLRFKKPDGKWGKYTDLKGEKGQGGGTVIMQSGGAGQFNPATLGEMPGGFLPADYLLIERNGSAYRVPVSALTTAGDTVTTYTKRTDFVTDSIFYRGEASPGTATSAAGWRIAKITLASDGDVAEIWANGSAEFTHVWDNRAALEYN